MEDATRKQWPSTRRYVEGVLAGDRATLARAITLVESNAREQMGRAQELLQALLPHSGRSFRLGITGAPGAGKSTFIETLGLLLVRDGHKVAVLAIDPSSQLTRGSILGDKTRMERLSRESSCYIRASPSAGTPGGVHRKTRETMVMVEAAGFDVVVVETVGVGQNETAVRSMVDCLLLLTHAGAGDELQRLKKGVAEFADVIVVNKADGDNRLPAETICSEYNPLLAHLRSPTVGWKTRAYACSALKGEGIPEIWSDLKRFRSEVTASGVLEQRRRAQLSEWLKAMVEERALQQFFSRADVGELLPKLEAAVVNGAITPAAAVQRLFGKIDAAR
jgi:LAO/AO transport system kinase